MEDGHNHLTAFGTINNIPIAICGGGGESGDIIGKLNGFSYGTSTNFGYCLEHFQKNKIVIQLIGTDGTVKHTHTFTK